MRLTRRHFVALAAAAVALPRPAVAQAVTSPSSAGPLSVATVARGLANPWGLAFLPDGRMLVTERLGRLRLLSPAGELSAPLAGVPQVLAAGQGGLLDVALALDFAASRLVFLSYAEAGEGGSGTALARGRLAADDSRLEDVAVIFRQSGKSPGGRHFAGRIVFARDGHLFLTLGDRGQDLNDHAAKVVRLTSEGAPAPGNPFAGRAGVRPEIWSSGHRNPQGAVLHPATGELWLADHGARGGDEINIAEAGKNYGWPVISYGRQYSGASIGEGTAKAGMEQPLHMWDPSIAPSGATFLSGDLFPAWRGHLFVGALRGTALHRLEFEGRRFLREERLLADLRERIRDVRTGPDGAVWLLTDSSDGRVLRVTPANGRS